MATISVEKRQLINGVTYRARVRITKKGKVIDKKNNKGLNMKKPLKIERQQKYGLRKQLRF